MKTRIKRALKALRNSKPNYTKKLKPQNPVFMKTPKTNMEYLKLLLEIGEKENLDLFVVPLKWNQTLRVGVPQKDVYPLFLALAEADETFAVTFRENNNFWRDSTRLELTSMGDLANRWTKEDLYPGATEEYAKAYYLHPATVQPKTRLDVLGAASVIELEIWTESQQGTYVSSLNNLHTNEIDISERKTCKTSIRGEDGFKTFEDFCFPTLDQIQYPIDAVYLWVDGSDDKWRNKKDTELKTVGEQTLPPETASESRFRNHNELMYSLRSLEMNAPWIRHVWIVTDNQIPNWLDLNNPKITVIDHIDIMPAEALPNFNSHALSANIHRIPGLSEHFLYLNDDVFFGAPSDPTFWFAPNGTSRIHYTNGKRPGSSIANRTVPVQARENAIRLTEVYSQNNGYQMRNLQHGPHPLSRSLMEEVWEKWEQELYATTLNKFRSDNDVEPIWLYNIYTTAMRYSEEGFPLSYSYVLMDKKDSQERLTELLTWRNKQVFCLNDGHSDNADEIDKLSDEERFTNYSIFLENYFAQKSSFEK